MKYRNFLILLTNIVTSISDAQYINIYPVWISYSRSEIRTDD